MMKSSLRHGSIRLLLLLCVLAVAPARAEEPKQSSEIKNSIGMKLERIPAGEFMMGGAEAAEDLVKAFAAYHRQPDFFSDEYPRHRVRITRPFYLGKYEVTVGEFRRFVDETGYKTEAERDGTGGWGYNPKTAKCEGRDLKYNWRDPGFPQTDEHPVLNVTWNDAVAFCQWLSRKEKQDYRLPTEAEWEYAARGGATTRYANGDNPDALAKIANVYDSTGRTTFPHVQELDIPPGSHPRFTVPVGGYPANGFGLCDVHGNVWEWCSDWHGEDYYAHSPVDDPKGPPSGTVRIRRGGGWNSFPLWARAAMRNWNTPKSRCVNLGFRVARSTPASEAKQPAARGETTGASRPYNRQHRDDEVTLVFAGDVMFDGGPGHAVMHGADPFAEFAPILRSADIAVCNLECVLARGGRQVPDKAFTFRGPTQAVPLLGQHFTAVSVANNHTGDWGPEAFSRQLDALSDAGIGCVGGGRSVAEARQPLILERNGLRIAILAYCGFPPRAFAAGKSTPGVAWMNESEMLEDIAAAREKHHADVVIPYLHWGRELRSRPADWQRDLAHRLIDGGASAVIGAHPHVTQTIETYGGRPIVYSLGNFVFDYFPNDPAVWTGWLVRLSFTQAGDVGLEKFSFKIDPAGIPHPVTASETAKKRAGRAST
ncbi:MAG: CapA family protein [Thermoguttaceae bacterium]